MTYPFKNLIFEGGGVKGLAFVGALEILEENHILENIKRFGGTSAGAITALLLGLGYNAKQIREKNL
ncbi:patatin-like phospholipase family protein [Peribacillus frigoritolerans]|nr:patatin-like phospholipase family protein [Peribacillus frigoritolerans]